jgi:hypothetical protein
MEEDDSEDGGDVIQTVSNHLFAKMARNQKKTLVAFFILGAFLLCTEGVHLYVGEKRDETPTQLRYAAWGLSGLLITVALLFLIWPLFNLICKAVPFSPGCRIIYKGEP